MSNLPTIIIKSIPHNRQHYETVGDYWRDKNGTLQFRVSQFGNEYEQLAVILHELIEAFLCQKRGIKWKRIDKFDKKYEKNRKEGDLSEPGNDPKAPYYREHRFAENLERQLIHELGIDWFNYDDEVNNL
jgi:Mn-dependent DtxR family transcriptional regulator